MRVSSDRFISVLALPPELETVRAQDRPWERVLRQLQDWLPRRELLDTLCAAVAAELSLSSVALFRREADGALSRIAGAERDPEAAQPCGQRAAADVFGVYPADPQANPRVACWTFSDRGHTDVLVFAGTQSSANLGGEWGPWALRMAEMIVRTTPGLDPTMLDADGRGTGDASFDAAAGPVPAWSGGEARFAAAGADIVDLEAPREQPRIRITLEGLDLLEPLGETGLRRLLDISAARVCAIAGSDRVTELDEGDFLVRLPEDASQAVQVLDALRRALLSPVPGIGPLPALGLRCSLA